jgi:hypothetical protein
MVKVPGGSFKVTYAPNELTAAREATIADEMDDTNAKSLALLGMYHDLVVHHELEGPLYAKADVYDEEGNLIYKVGDLVVDDGDNIPTTPEYTQHLPSALINKILTAVQEDMNPDPKSRSKSSGGGSYRRGN